MDGSNRVIYTNAAWAIKNERFDPAEVGEGLFLVTTLDAGGAGGLKVALSFPFEPMEPKKPSPFFVRFLERSMWWLFALIVFSAAMIGVIVRSFNRDIGRLIGATRRVAEGDLDFELPAKGNDEIASLTRSFDSMRKNLKESIARRSRFLMGVSHDLKTPLTSIKGYLEAISDGLADDPEKLDTVPFGDRRQVEGAGGAYRKAHRLREDGDRGLEDEPGRDRPRRLFSVKSPGCTGRTPPFSSGASCPTCGYQRARERRRTEPSCSAASKTSSTTRFATARRETRSL